MTPGATEAEGLFPLGEQAFRELSAHAVERKLRKGDRLWRAGDEPEAVWMVRKGRVNMVLDGPNGNSALVHFCTLAQTFCPAAAISGKPYPCAAVAATDTVVIAVPRSSFMAFFKDLPNMVRSLLAQMSTQLCDTHCRQAQNGASVKNRLASLLRGLHRRYAGCDLPFTRQELADMSGTTVESAIRTLSQWEKSGVIESERGSIHIQNPRALEDAAV